LLTSCRPDWRPLVDRPLLLGIRPEDVSLAEGPEDGRLEMELRMLERLGPLRLATLSAASWTVTARLDALPAVREGATVFAAFELTRAHLFDPATGQAVGSRQSAVGGR
jgi:multiple sugar transport system ATP-binding protein